MNFLPEDDRDALLRKQLQYELKTEKLPDGTMRRGIVFPAFIFDANLFFHNADQFIRCVVCELMVIIPKGYATTKLDSFYTNPNLKRQDGSNPDRATGAETIFGRPWQFWSRHLTDQEWRPGIDGLETYLQYIHAELRRA